METAQKTSPAMDKKLNDKELYLVDASAFIFRAYHALPPLTAPDGTPVGAVLGFTNMMVRLLNDFHAPYVGVIFDCGRVTFRNDIYDQYKANRDETPEDLIPQFPLVRRATEAFGLEVIEKQGFEADDLIAAYAKAGAEQGFKVTIVSSDKDLMQLVNDDVRMMDPIKQRFIDHDGVVEKFGVTPDKVVDVQALAGDSVDNVPGVPGIGIKTAALLINEYGDLETLLQRAGEIKQNKRRENLIEFAEQARISKQLVQLVDDIELPHAINVLDAHDPKRPEVLDFLKIHHFNSVLTRLGEDKVKSAPMQAKSFSAPANDEEAAALPHIDMVNIEKDYMTISTPEDLSTWLEDAKDTGFLSFDTETTALTPAKAELVGISLSSRAGRACYIPLSHKAKPVDLLSDESDADNTPQMPLSAAMGVLQPYFEDPSILKIAHNAKYDLQILWNAGFGDVAPLEDTMLMSYTLDGAQHGHGMDFLALENMGIETVKFSDVCGKGKNQITFDYVPIKEASIYAAEDADITLRLYNIFKPRIAHEKVTRIYEDIERRLSPVIARVESNGVVVEPLILKELSDEFSKRIITIEQDIYKQAGHEFNIASPKQLGGVLFDELGLEGGKKTKSGDWSTSVDVLEKLELEGHEIVKKIMQFRSLSKLKSTYTDSLQNEIISETGRVHTSFHMALTSTGRLSSSDPNLQNIPIRSEDGRRIRTAFVAPKGHKIICADYSQVELRLVAAMANVKLLKDAFLNGEDIHALTASQVFGHKLEDVTPELRRSAKAVNFGIIYGISAFGLAKQLGCSRGEAKSFIDAYFSRFPEIPAFMEAAKEEARKYGYVKTLFGRKCFIAGINDKNGMRRQFGERQATNAPLQGTAADVIKLAMIRIDRRLRDEHPDTKMILQIHDEVMIEVPDAKVDVIKALVVSEMENAAKAVDIGLPLIAEADAAQSWADAH
jgi:DNA polymerase-1